MNQEVFLELAFSGKMLVAFLFGGLSFISPCVLPLVPSYISFITGISFEELTDEAGSKIIKKIILHNSLMFVLGFSTFFIVVLGASATFFGAAFFEYQEAIRMVGGAIIVLLGIHIMGVINIGVLQREKRLHFFRDKPAGLAGSYFVGVSFAAGWTPCIGPILGGIFMLASTSPNSAMLLFVAYSAGLAIPFLLTSLGINSFLKYSHNLKKHMRWVSVVTGLLLIFTGILIFLGKFASIAGKLSDIIPIIG